MDQSKFLLLFFSLLFSACDSNLDPDKLISFNSEPFSFKIIPGKAKTPASIMPAGFGPIRGPSTTSAGVENSINKDLSKCRDNLLNQQVHFEFNF
ncbi:MAG: hypothetical protein WA659_03120 [Candidatus Aquirickettsiella sp.]